jgi:hypothetical protein
MVVKLTWCRADIEVANSEVATHSDRNASSALTLLEVIHIPQRSGSHIRQSKSKYLSLQPTARRVISGDNTTTTSLC